MKSAGASAFVTTKAVLIRAWLFHHKNVLSSSIFDLLQHKFYTAINWSVIAVSLALPSFLYLLLSNISSVTGDWGGKPRISIYLDSNVTLIVGKRMVNEIAINTWVEKANFISSNSALLEFKKRSGFGELLRSLDENPLPHVIEVVPKTMDPLILKGLIETWEKSENISKVSVDLAWLERLHALLKFGERLLWFISVVLALGVILIMGNTIRSAIENRRKEIEVMKLFGATNSFVRRPFLYLGFWYGFGGAFISIALLQGSLILLAGPVEAIARSYQGEFALNGLGILGCCVLLIVGSMLGVVGALFAVSRHLSSMEP